MPKKKIKKKSNEALSQAPILFLNTAMVLVAVSAMTLMHWSMSCLLGVGIVCRCPLPWGEDRLDDPRAPVLVTIGYLLLGCYCCFELSICCLECIEDYCPLV